LKVLQDQQDPQAQHQLFLVQRDQLDLLALKAYLVPQDQLVPLVLQAQHQLFLVQQDPLDSPDLLVLHRQFLVQQVQLDLLVPHQQYQDQQDLLDLLVQHQQYQDQQDLLEILDHLVFQAFLDQPGQQDLLEMPA
jgi:hypothetical protein